MMTTPQQEAVSLKDEPLPVILTPDDEWLPSLLFQTDDEIARLQEQLSVCQEQRRALIDRIIATGFKEDIFCRVTEKVKTFRKLDVAAFGANEPEKYLRACEWLRAELEDQLQKVGENIPLKMVDMLTKKSNQDAFITTTETRTYAAERKEVV